MAGLTISCIKSAADYLFMHLGIERGFVKVKCMAQEHGELKQAKSA